MRLSIPAAISCLFLTACGEDHGVVEPGPDTELITIEELLAPTPPVSFEESERRAMVAEKILKEEAKKVVAGDVAQSQAAMKQFAEHFVGSDPATRHSEVHIFWIEHVGPQAMVTSASVEAKAKGADGRFKSVRFEIATNWFDADTEPTLGTILIAEKAHVVESDQLWFMDRTVPVIGGDSAFQHQLSHGLDHWLGRVEAAHGIDCFIRNGMAVGDADGDGRDDIYVCQPGGLPNRLFIQQADGTVKTVADSGADYLDHTSSALFVDLDNDGDQDLALATPAGIILLENTGEASFEARGTLRTDAADCHSLTATDFNLDGKLDLYITFALGTQYPGEDAGVFHFHDARDGGANQLFRGDGDWSFSEVTDFVGLGENNDRHSLAAAWADYDLDGDPDLYIANDYGSNQLYINKLEENKKGSFSIAESQQGVEDLGAGMSVSWGDANRDGRPDLYVGNMFSNAGGRMTGLAGYLGDGSKKFVRGLPTIRQGQHPVSSIGRRPIRGSRKESGNGSMGVEQRFW